MDRRLIYIQANMRTSPHQRLVFAVYSRFLDIIWLLSSSSLAFVMFIYILSFHRRPCSLFTHEVNLPDKWLKRKLMLTTEYTNASVTHLLLKLACGRLRGALQECRPQTLRSASAAVIVSVWVSGCWHGERHLFPAQSPGRPRVYVCVCVDGESEEIAVGYV